jgi:aryl-alcohol dehydrogenase-like predicted oxidoreductase
VGLVPWSPLARGFLSGSRKRGEGKETARARSDEFADKLYFRDEDFDVLDALLEVASARGLPAARLALAWLRSRPGVVAPIIGATKLPHLEDAVAALEVKLSPEEIAKLEAPSRPHPILGHEQPKPA